MKVMKLTLVMTSLIVSVSAHALPVVQIAECHTTIPKGVSVQVFSVGSGGNSYLARIDTMAQGTSGNVRVSQVAAGYYQDAGGDFQLYIEHESGRGLPEYKIYGRFHSPLPADPAHMVYFPVGVPVTCTFADH